MQEVVEQGRGARTGARVLVVDDDAVMRTLVERCLATIGVAAAHAQSGAQALEWLEQNRADLLYLDYRLNDMTADELIDRLRARGNDNEFIVVTGYGDERLAVKMMKSGARDYLLKDTSLSELLPTVIEQNLDAIRRERRLQEAEESLHLLGAAVRHAREAVVIERLDPPGAPGIVFLNPAFTRLTGLAAEAATGRPLGELLAERAAEGEADRLRELDRALPLEGRFALRGPVDAERLLDVALTPIGAAARGAEHVLVLLRDVTESAQLEEVRRHSQKMEAVGSLAGGVAHDFNNLLTVILSYAELLLGDPDLLRPSGRDHVDQIMHAGEHAAALTRQLLAFSRKTPGLPRVFDLVEAVEGVRGMLRRSIGEEVELVFEHRDGPLYVRMDPSHAEQVLLNLVLNARDALGGRGRIDVVTSRQEPTPAEAAEGVGPRACVAVRDEGTGIDPDVLPHVFEPFYTTKEIGKGTGLGLSTVYGIVREAGGEVRVESRPGEGSCFTVRMPLQHAPLDLPREVRAPAPGPRRATVLVVEDEDLVRRMVVEALRRGGHEVLEAGDAPEALQVLAGRGHELDLLVTDMVMPGGSGLDLAQRARDLRPELRLLFVSGYTHEMQGEVGRRFDGGEFLQKPFTPKDLRARVRRLLDEPGPGSAGE